MLHRWHITTNQTSPMNFQQWISSSLRGCRLEARGMSNVFEPSFVDFPISSHTKLQSSDI